MAYELTFSLGGNTHTAFLQEGFCHPGTPSQNLHRHSYPEIHVLSGGNATFQLGGDILDFTDGDVFAIPAGLFHRCLSAEDALRHTAFQADIPLRDFAAQHFDHHLLNSFLEEIPASRSLNSYGSLQAYLSLLCCVFCRETSPKIRESADHAFLIHEFFSHSYREDVSLADLAKQLHFSEKHTARLVLRHTGRTFSQALTAQRMTIAEHLAKSTDMPLTQIALYVGYRSYSGFWKAYRKHLDLLD